MRKRKELKRNYRPEEVRKGRRNEESGKVGEEWGKGDRRELRMNLEEDEDLI
uniref:Uncharacterized protein n=1 Tax=Cucumis melo TaxID=3656 RepID=A0A9I9D5F3_CUCME